MIDPTSVAAAAANRLTVRSALNPLLWLCGIVAVPCFAMASYRHADRTLMWALLGTGWLPLAVTCVIACCFAYYKPEKLQSDDYQLREKFLQMLQNATMAEVLAAQGILTPNVTAGASAPAAPSLAPAPATVAPAPDAAPPEAPGAPEAT